jgi:hypothetical protein
VLRRARHEEGFIALSADAIKKNPHPELVEGHSALMQRFVQIQRLGVPRRVLRQAQHEEDVVAIGSDAMKIAPHAELVEAHTKLMQRFALTHMR